MHLFGIEPVPGSRRLAAFPAASEQGKQLIALAHELGIAAEGMTE